MSNYRNSLNIENKIGSLLQGKCSVLSANIFESIMLRQFCHLPQQLDGRFQATFSDTFRLNLLLEHLYLVKANVVSLWLPYRTFL